MEKKRLSGRKLRQWFKNSVREAQTAYTIDKAQAKVVLDDHKNTLVTARAGSGKTRTIVAKVVYLIAKENVRPEEIIIFAFNRKARAELNDRLEKITVDGRPLLKSPTRITTTFHAFAFRLLGRPETFRSADFPDGEDRLFSQMVVEATANMPKALPYKYIFIDEYQDFSALFFMLVQALRRTCPNAKLLAVGDDWQAINHFAGSELKYFQEFDRYFPEDSKQLFLLNNYRSGRAIVKNANFFMAKALKDFRGGKAKSRQKATIKLVNVSDLKLSRRQLALSLLLEQYFAAVARIILRHKGKTIKILHRNNNLSLRGWSLDQFCNALISNLEAKGALEKSEAEKISYSTVHRSKGLEADVVILLELDPNVFPGRHAELDDEIRLFYVALTRAKTRLYLLSKSRPSPNNPRDFRNYLDYDIID